MMVQRARRTELQRTVSGFLDDGLGAAPNHIKAKFYSLAVHSDLFKSGFLLNEEKSVWDPTQSITHLGTVVSSAPIHLFL